MTTTRRRLIRKGIARLLLAPPGLALLFASACGGGVAVGEQADPVQFRNVVNAGSDLDYNPSTSPNQLVQDADAIVVGRVVDIQEAKQLYEDGAAERFAILEVIVERVIDGELRGDDASTVFVAMYVSQISAWSDIRASVPLDRGLFVLTDLADWNYSGRLEGFPGIAYFPRPDGLWFEDVAGKPAGVWAELADVEIRWGVEFNTLDELVATLEDAAAKE